MSTYTVVFELAGKAVATYEGLPPGKALDLANEPNVDIPDGCTVRITEER